MEKNKEPNTPDDLGSTPSLLAGETLFGEGQIFLKLVVHRRGRISGLYKGVKRSAPLYLETVSDETCYLSYPMTSQD